MFFRFRTTSENTASLFLYFIQLNKNSTFSKGAFFVELDIVLTSWHTFFCQLFLFDLLINFKGKNFLFFKKFGMENRFYMRFRWYRQDLKSSLYRRFIFGFPNQKNDRGPFYKF